LRPILTDPRPNLSDPCMAPVSHRRGFGSSRLHWTTLFPRVSYREHLSALRSCSAPQVPSDSVSRPSARRSLRSAAGARARMNREIRESRGARGAAPPSPTVPPPRVVRACSVQSACGSKRPFRFAPLSYPAPPFVPKLILCCRCAPSTAGPVSWYKAVDHAVPSNHCEPSSKRGFR
jgi:hypothetical protein